MDRHIADYLHYAAADRGFSSTTLATVTADLGGLERFLRSQQDDGADICWSLVDRDRIRLWVAHKTQRGIQPQSLRRAMCSLRSFFRYLLLVGVIQADPMRLIPNPRQPRRLPTFLRETEMDRLLDHVAFPDTFEGHRDHLILLTFYSCGLRVSELVGMDLDSVSMERSEMRVLGKRNKHRVVPFGPEMHQALAAYLTERARYVSADALPLFTTSQGRRLTTDGVRRIVKTYLSMVTTAAKRTPHVLRHTFATVMLNHGADLEAVKSLLGHESVATTQIYTHTTFAQLQDAYEQAHPRLRRGSGSEESGAADGSGNVKGGKHGEKSW